MSRDRWFSFQFQVSLFIKIIKLSLFISDWYEENNVLINNDKHKFIFSTFRTPFFHNYYPDNIVLRHMDEYRDLYSTVESILSFDKHYLNIIKVNIDFRNRY